MAISKNSEKILFTTICMLPQFMRNVKRAMSVSTNVNSRIPRLGAARVTRDAICNAFLKRQRLRRLNVNDNDSLNEVVYEAGRDGFIAALAHHLGPARVTGPERVDLQRVIDTMRTKLPFDQIKEGGTFLSFEDYVKRITDSSLTFISDLHEIVRPNVHSVDYTDAAFALAALVAVALMPFTIAKYLSQLAQVTELTFMVQAYMKVLHRHFIADQLAHMRDMRNLFDKRNQGDRKVLLGIMTIETSIRNSAMHQLTAEDVTAQMAIVMRTSKHANSTSQQLAESQRVLADKVARVRDFKYREKVEVEEIAHEKKVYYAWLIACVVFFAAGTFLLLTEKHVHFLALLAVIAALLLISLAVKYIRKFVRG